MNTKSFEHALQTLKYPNIDRTLGELKLISSVKVTDGNAHVELTTVSDESYLSVKTLIENSFADQFKSLNITKKAQTQKDTNYGNTAPPNNRAPYAKNVLAVTSG